VEEKTVPTFGVDEMVVVVFSKATAKANEKIRLYKYVTNSNPKSTREAVRAEVCVERWRKIFDHRRIAKQVLEGYCTRQVKSYVRLEEIRFYTSGKQLIDQENQKAWAAVERIKRRNGRVLFMHFRDVYSHICSLPDQKSRSIKFLTCSCFSLTLTRYA
jgi:hypothetical protein